MNIFLKELTIINFKGIKKLVIKFFQQTFIRGANATGKSTVFDAFTWLLFGKDSSDRKDFIIKPLDKVGRPLQKTENEVSAVLEIDGINVTLRRVHKEKWVKKKGALEPEFAGNETLFFYNDVPLQQQEYQAKISALVDEKIFKLLTSTTYFNSLPWLERRGILMNLAGNITNEEVAALLSGDGWADLLAELNRASSIEEYKRMIASRKKKIKDEMQAIPTRIDEINRSLPIEDKWEEIKKSIAKHQAEIKSIEETISDRSIAYQNEFKVLSAKQKDLNDAKLKRSQFVLELRSQRTQSYNEAKASIEQKTRQISHINTDIASSNKRIEAAKARVATLTSENQKLRQQWNELNGKEISFDFNTNDFNCPTCKQRLPADKVEEQRDTLTKNFNDDKARKLAEITNRGTVNATEVTDQESLIARLQGEIRDLENKRDALDIEREGMEKVSEPKPLTDEELSVNEEYQQLSKQVAALEASQGEAPQLDLQDLKEKKQEHANQLDILKSALGKKDQRDAGLKRIRELEQEEQNFAQQLADLEQKEFQIQQFSKAKIDALEARINGMFQYVRFKMFDQQINGAMVETCETMVDGVPYSNLNTAARINAGLDIINALAAHYQVHAPIFCDNRESINDLLPTDSQVINLIVSQDRALEVA